MTVVNLVLNTDIASPERTQLAKSKFKEAFGERVKRTSAKKTRDDHRHHQQEQQQQKSQHHPQPLRQRSTSESETSAQSDDYTIPITPEPSDNHEEDYHLNGSNTDGVIISSKMGSSSNTNTRIRQPSDHHQKELDKLDSMIRASYAAAAADNDAINNKAEQQ
jgi:hypothetical protein